MHRSRFAGIIIDCRTEDIDVNPGQRSCFMRVANAHFDVTANTWDDT